MTPSPAEAAFLKARLAAAQVRRSRKGTVFSCAGLLLPVGLGAIQAAPMQGSGSAAAMGGSVSPFGRTCWLLMSLSGCLGASAAWQTLVLALLRFARAARSAALRREAATAAVSWLTATERRAEHNLWLGSAAGHARGAQHTELQDCTRRDAVVIQQYSKAAGRSYTGPRCKMQEPVTKPNMLSQNQTAGKLQGTGDAKGWRCAMAMPRTTWSERQVATTPARPFADGADRTRAVAALRFTKARSRFKIPSEAGAGRTGVL